MNKFKICCLSLVSIFVITMLTGCGASLQQVGGVALLLKMFDDNGNAVTNSAPLKTIGVNGLVVLKKTISAPSKGSKKTDYMIEFYKDHNSSIADVTVPLDSNLFYIANNLGFHPEKTIVKDGTTVLGQIKNKKQSFADDVKKIEIRQKIVINLSTDQTECTTMKLLQKEKTIERQFLTGTPEANRVNDMNVVPLSAFIELSQEITKCSIQEIQKINSFINDEFIEVVVKRNASDFAQSIEKHLLKFEKIADINELDSTELKNNLSEIADGDISPDIILDLDLNFKNINTINEDIDAENIITLKNNGNSINIKNTDDLETFTVKLTDSNGKVGFFQIIDEVLFIDKNVNEYGVTITEIGDEEYNISFSNLVDGKYNVQVFVEGNSCSLDFDYKNDLPLKFKVYQPSIVDTNPTIDGTLKIEIRWVKSESNNVSHYQVIGKTEIDSNEEIILGDNLNPVDNVYEFEYPVGGMLYVSVAAVTEDGQKTICQELDNSVSLNMILTFSDVNFEKMIRYYANIDERIDIYADDIVDLEFFSNLKLPEGSYPFMNDMTNANDFDVLSQWANSSGTFLDGQDISLSLIDDYQDLKYLRNLKELFLMDLNNIKSPSKTAAVSTISGLESIKKLKDLENISLITFSNFDSSYLENAPNLRQIWLFETYLSDYNNLSLNNQNLETVLAFAFYGSTLIEQIIDGVESINLLKNLFIISEEPDLTIANVEKIQFMEDLERLFLVDVGLNNIEFLSGLSNLEVLNIEHNDITDISPLKNLPLKILNFEGNDVLDLTPLKQNTTLENSEAQIYLNTDKYSISVLDELEAYIGKRPTDHSRFPILR